MEPFQYKNDILPEYKWVFIIGIPILGKTVFILKQVPAVH